ncbi:MAG TPA: hypothetical protein VI408_16520 [Gaiellaceae bacterium]
MRPSLGEPSTGVEREAQRLPLATAGLLHYAARRILRRSTTLALRALIAIRRAPFGRGACFGAMAEKW